MSRGDDYAKRGDFEKAIVALQKASAVYQAKKEPGKEIQALLNLAVNYQALGQHPLAMNTLDRAVSLADKTGEPSHLIAVKAALGAALPVAREADRAEDLLKSALALARENKEQRAVAAILNNLGNLLAAQRIFPEARARYAECVEVANRLDDHQLASQALANAGLAAELAGESGDAARLNLQALQATDKLEPSHEKANLFLKIVHTYQLIVAHQPAAKPMVLISASEACQKAIAVATNLNDGRALTYGLGQQGALYELDGQAAEALRWTRQAAFIARQINALEALYRWEWQIGRLLKAQGQPQAALASYQRAVKTLRDIQFDCGISYGNRDVGSNFRQSVGGLFFELADLLLQQAEAGDSRQNYLFAARQTVEQLKFAELEDYFQDDCLHLLLTKASGIETNSPRTAVIYFIPLSDRLELLLSLPSGLQRFKLPVTESELTQAVDEFRGQLEDPAAEALTPELLRVAKRLYQWLIAPINLALTAEQIDTLVFVPDGALRRLPLSALYDGEEFLARKYAIAVTPGLTLMDPQPLRRKTTSLLLCGLSEAVQGFPALDYVLSEVRNVQTNYPAKVLLNRGFLKAQVASAFEQSQFSIVHFASHGHFARDAKKSFLLTYDGRLTFDDLERLVRPSQARGHPVELLVLSACESAAGDDRATLGLAGVAIKAGARSALATLWSANDEACALLISEFYSQMRQAPSLSRAKALQAAQLKLINDPRYRHPAFWSPFLMIGNWL